MQEGAFVTVDVAFHNVKGSSRSPRSLPSASLPAPLCLDLCGVLWTRTESTDVDPFPPYSLNAEQPTTNDTTPESSPEGKGQADGAENTAAEGAGSEESRRKEGDK